MKPLELARSYIARGWAVLPLAPGQKNPMAKQWGLLRITDEDAQNHFTSDYFNVGIITGQASNDLVDIDLDCFEAEVIAPNLLPPTEAVFGHMSKPRSHYLYYSAAKTAKYKTIDGQMMLEVRANKCQTVFPGSVHSSGERIEWDCEGEPTTVLPSILEDSVRRIAACCLLARAWSNAKGSRHDIALTIAGGLLAAGWSVEEAKLFVVSAATAAGDDQIEDRERAVSDTFESTEEKIRGWTSAEAIIGRAVTQRMRDLLGASTIAMIDASFALGGSRTTSVGTTVPNVDGAPLTTVDRQGRELPIIVTTGRLPFELADDAVEALVAINKPPETFIWSGALSRVRDIGAGPIVEVLSDKHLEERMGWVAHFVSQGKKGYVTVDPPVKMVVNVNRRKTWLGIPTLQGVTQTPILRPDGTILSTPGYDEKTGLYFQPPSDFLLPDIPDRPTRNEQVQALNSIVNVLFDIRFKGEADRANTIALLLTPLIRSLVDVVPLAVIDAPIQGSGKTMITDIVSVIAKGVIPGKGGAPKDNEEMDKRITALLMAGKSFIVFDDVATLRSNALTRALTSSFWSGRRLGHSEEVTVPQRATWIVTGNNVDLKDDLPRRCFWIRLDPQMARPWLRTDFRIDPLIPFVQEHRAELLAALLTLARSWYVSGQPKAKVEPIGGFGQWTRLIGGILEHTGIPGFLENKEALYDQADDEAGQWENFFHSCHDLYRDQVITASEITLEIEGFNSTLVLALPDILVEGRGPNQRQDFKRLLGVALAKRADRMFGDYKIVRCGLHPKKKVVQWKFIRVTV